MCLVLSQALGLQWCNTGFVREALRFEPNNPEALAKKSSAEILLGDLSDVEDDAAKAVAAGASVTIPVDHVGFICSLGTLTKEEEE